MLTEIDMLKRLASPDGGKIVFVVIDGLGGLPDARTGKTALESADTPHLDSLAESGISGLHEPVGAGITPGSGPGHLALFGYDPLEYEIGRGVLSALGIDYPLSTDQVVARGNFCTLDGEGRVADRRAGRISTDTAQTLCEKLNDIELENRRFEVKAVKEHRFLLVLKGENLGAAIKDTDPHVTGARPGPPERADESDDDSRHTVALLDEFIGKAEERLRGESDANGILLRGFGKLPDIPKLPDHTRMRCKAIAAYPMYRGVSRLAGMEVLEAEDDLEDQFKHLQSAWDSGDFFFVHVKKTDAFGEDGDFQAKVDAIGEVDRWLPRLPALEPDVLLVTGDHSTPARLSAHSWHPVPVLLHAPETVRPDPVARFSENAALQGALGPRFPGKKLMTTAMAHAKRLRKFGA